MSAPPATIHEPPSIPPTRIETIPNITAGSIASSRKRPRDLFVEGEEGGRQVNILCSVNLVKLIISFEKYPVL